MSVRLLLPFADETGSSVSAVYASKCVLWSVTLRLFQRLPGSYRVRAEPGTAQVLEQHLQRGFPSPITSKGVSALRAVRRNEVARVGSRSA